MRGASVIAVVVLVTAAVAGAAAGPKQKIDRDSKAGTDAAIFVSGEVLRPRKFIVQFKSTPAGQPFEGTASISCRNAAFEFTDRTRPVAATTPAKLRIAPTKGRAAYCSVGVSAATVFSEDGSSTGRLTATLYVKQRR